MVRGWADGIGNCTQLPCRATLTIENSGTDSMLRELHISNLAVISDAKIELGSGLNCFTGATGAGKSLVIGAVELLLGLRSPAEMLRSGADEGRVSGLFDVNPTVLKRIESTAD